MARGFGDPAYMVGMTDIISTSAAAARENARTVTGQFGEQQHSAPELELDDLRPTLDPVQWTPEAASRGEFANVLIARETNPWLQVNGEPVDLTGIDTGTPADCDCCNDGGAYAGVILAMDTSHGIQMCDMCGKFEGDLEAAQHAAEVLTKSTGRVHTVWFEPEPAAAGPSADAPAPFVFDKNYDNHEQVRPYMDDFNRVYDELVESGRYPYNDSFRGRIPSLGDVDSKNEDTAIYMLQTLRTLDEEAKKRDAFLESGGRKVTVEDLADGQVLRGTVVKAGFYMGGTGWSVHENIRLRVHTYPNGRRELTYVEKGKRNGHSLGDGDIYFRED